MQRACWLKFVWIGGGNLNGLEQEMMMMMQLIMMVMMKMEMEMTIMMEMMNVIMVVMVVIKFGQASKTFKCSKFMISRIYLSSAIKGLSNLNLFRQGEHFQINWM